ncbi:MAG: hypothetical protein Q8P20_09650 [bacterium]|nr:hypothetical protein [bacterium]
MADARLMPMSEGSNYNVYVPSIDFYANKILNKDFFSYVKLSIEWWMLVIKGLPRCGIKLAEMARKKEQFINKLSHEMIRAWEVQQRGARKYHCSADIVARIIRMSISPKPLNFFLGVTDRCNVNHVTFPLPARGKNLVPIIRATLPQGEIPIHALPFRIWAVTGEINEFINKIRHKNIVIVGPSHLANFGDKLNIKNFHFVEIHSYNAALHVAKTKAQIKKLHSTFMSGHDDVTYFFIGGSVAMWLITELHGELDNANLIDIGRAFDVYYFYDLAMKQYPNWMFGQWLNRRNTAWIKTKMSPDKNGAYRINE